MISKMISRMMSRPLYPPAPGLVRAAGGRVGVEDVAHAAHRGADLPVAGAPRAAPQVVQVVSPVGRAVLRKPGDRASAAPEVSAVGPGRVARARDRHAAAALGHRHHRARRRRGRGGGWGGRVTPGTERRRGLPGAADVALPAGAVVVRAPPDEQGVAPHPPRAEGAADHPDPIGAVVQVCDGGGGGGGTDGGDGRGHGGRSRRQCQGLGSGWEHKQLYIIPQR